MNAHTALLRWIFAVVLLGWAGLLPAQSRPQALESGVVVRMEAPIEADGAQHLVLRMVTNDLYDCAEAEIIHQLTRKASQFKLVVKGVQESPDCTMDIGPAEAKIPLGKLEPGVYAFKMIINRQIFKASLKVGADHFELRTGDDPDLFRVGNGRLNLIPADILWGKAIYSTEDQRAQAQALVAALIAAGARTPDLPAGDYGKFYVHYDSAPDEVALGPERYALPFVLTYGGPLADLKPVFDAYQSKFDLAMENRAGERLAP